MENDNSEFSQKNLSLLRSKSPTSLKITFRQIRNGSDLNFEDCMKMEFRMVSKVMDDHDFYEGVRALIIDKDNTPYGNQKLLKKFQMKKSMNFLNI